MQSMNMEKQLEHERSLEAFRLQFIEKQQQLEDQLKRLKDEARVIQSDFMQKNLHYKLQREQFNNNAFGTNDSRN